MAARFVRRLEHVSEARHALRGQEIWMTEKHHFHEVFALSHVRAGAKRTMRRRVTREHEHGA
jgi:hypothetical protein